MKEVPVGKAEILLEGDTLALICLGPVTNRALEAARDFPGRVGVFDFRFLKPIDTAALDGIADRYAHILTLEDGSLKGGLYGAVCEHLACRRNRPVIEGAGIPDAFTVHARQADQRRDCGLDKEGIAGRIAGILSGSKK